MMDDGDVDAIAIEDPVVDQNNTCREMNDFENVTKSTLLQLTGVNVNLS